MGTASENFVRPYLTFNLAFTFTTFWHTRWIALSKSSLGRGGCPQVSKALREGDPTARFKIPTRSVGDNGPYLTPSLNLT